MTASGPFAMGPALAGNNGRRSAPRSNFAPVMPRSKSGPTLAVSLTHSAVPSLKSETGVRDKDKGKEIMETLGDEEVYSEPDEGVEIVDMENVRQMDWMAPESLRKGRHLKKLQKGSPSDNAGICLHFVLCHRASTTLFTVTGDIDRANALDLSESEEEEELEAIMEHFAANTDVKTVRF